MAVNQRKVAAVRHWPVPQSNVELRRFVGLCNYYRRFVDGYADIAAPLKRLCAPHALWHFGPAKQASFDTLKQFLTTAPVLCTFDSSPQPDDDGQHHPVAYESRKLTAAEQAYRLHVLELLAPCACFDTTCSAAVLTRPQGSFRTSRSEPTTRRSHGCARSGTSTARGVPL